MLSAVGINPVSCFSDRDKRVHTAQLIAGGDVDGQKDRSGAWTQRIRTHCLNTLETFNEGGMVKFLAQEENLARDIELVKLFDANQLIPTRSTLTPSLWRSLTTQHFGILPDKLDGSSPPTGSHTRSCHSHSCRTLQRFCLRSQRATPAGVRPSVSTRRWR